MRLIITAFPYATQTGYLNVPDEGVEYEKYQKDARKWVEDHWDEIMFREPELDYCGTEFEIDEGWGTWV